MNHPQGNTAGSGKILFLCSDLETGGIQRVIVNLANGLAEKGMDITCAVLHRGGTFRSQLSPKVRLDELGCTSHPLALFSPFSGLARCLGVQGPGTVEQDPAALPLPFGGFGAQHLRCAYGCNIHLAQAAVGTSYS